MQASKTEALNTINSHKQMIQDLESLFSTDKGWSDALGGMVRSSVLDGIDFLSEVFPIVAPIAGIGKSFYEAGNAKGDFADIETVGKGVLGIYSSSVFYAEFTNPSHLQNRYIDEDIISKQGTRIIGRVGGAAAAAGVAIKGYREFGPVYNNKQHQSQILDYHRNQIRNTRSNSYSPAIYRERRLLKKLKDKGCS